MNITLLETNWRVLNGQYHFCINVDFDKNVTPIRVRYILVYWNFIIQNWKFLETVPLFRHKIQQTENALMYFLHKYEHVCLISLYYNNVVLQA